jgi:hypothetical protein
MGFPQSPGIYIREIDLTTVVKETAASTGAFAGVFRWGPIGERVLIDSEDTLLARFGKPTNFNAETWFTLSSFLSYGGFAYTVRAANTTSTNGSIGVLSAFGNTGTVANVLSQMVKNETDYVAKDGTFDSDVRYIARYPGELGNSLRTSEVFTPNDYTSSLNLASYGTGASMTINLSSNTATITIAAGSITLANAAAETLTTQVQATDLLQVGNSTIGTQYMKLTSVGYTPGSDATGNTTTGTALVHLQFEDVYVLHTTYVANSTVNTSLTRFWEFYSLVRGAPNTSPYVYDHGNTSAIDEVHTVVVDDKGKFTGVPGTVLEVYQGLSRATDARQPDGGTNYYKDVINQRSQYVWVGNDNANAVSNTSASVTSASTTQPLNLYFNQGADGGDESNCSIAILANAFDKFASAEDVDVGLVMTGKSRGGIDGTQLPNYLIDNIAEVRKDCVVFVSPSKDDVVNNRGNEVTSIRTFRNNLRASSYGFLDSGYKYFYDRYNDVYRWVPLNGDMAGLCVRTDVTNDAWWSPGGFNRGQIKNLVQLAFNPRKAERDVLYPIDVNPVVSFPGKGTVLFGDKTLLGRNSAFSRINVRRLFIVLEKAIGEASLGTLFEFNDSFTRAQFRSMVNPYLRDVKGRRGLTDFLVVCDESNNPGQVIDNYEFVADIYLKPARAINFIQLNFVAVATGVQFSEVVGRFGTSSG